MPTPRLSYSLVYAVVARIPRGRVATYGQVAALAGLPGQPRFVGYALHALSKNTRIPWQRVVNARGRTSPRSDGMGHERLQELMLRREGVRFSKEGVLSLPRYQWRPRAGWTERPGVVPSRRKEPSDDPDAPPAPSRRPGPSRR